MEQVRQTIINEDEKSKNPGSYLAETLADARRYR